MAERARLFEQGLKPCSKCGAIKPLDGFNKRLDSKDGKESQCRECTRARHRRRNANGPRAKAIREREELRSKGLKKCTRCQATKPLDQFGKKGCAWDGLNGWCRDCESAYKKEYRSIPENAETERAQSRKWKRENREAVHEYNKQWNSENPERKRVLRRRWHLAHKEEENAKARVRTQEWMRANPDHYQTLQANRRARDRGAPGRFTRKQWATMKQLCGYRCVACGRKKKLTRDHIIPLTHPGTSSWITNIQPLCKKCNSEKQDRHSTDYRPGAVRQWALEETHRLMQKDGYEEGITMPHICHPEQLSLAI